MAASDAVPSTSGTPPAECYVYGSYRSTLQSGAEPDARTTKHPWYMVYGGCGNRNCGLVGTKGSTAFWRAAYAADLEAMRLLVKYGADPNIPTIAPEQRRRRPRERELVWHAIRYPTIPTSIHYLQKSG
ncbi:MAG: hypothetical protein CM1200mP14_06810 [Gammaproteobacteria bacterium]|nr:MAG: hypothetical protein CM1200mP14_06810 [Gammaproteobacteria bacterium]